MRTAHPVDLRSDTVTQPTDAMRAAMAAAVVGDDVLGEDPTINELESEAAALLGKQAALFAPSGTFANQCAILTHTRSGDEILLSEDCHIVQHEAGAAALLSRVNLRSVAPRNGSFLTVEDLTWRFRFAADDIHFPDTRLVCLEQATASGEVYPLETLKQIRETTARAGVRVHIDGARLFNAAVALGVEAAELAACADSVSVCLSKGLCAPVGSLLCGDAAFVARARKNRKIMGGGMRQAGFLAAAGLEALRVMRLRLYEDHANARLLADLLAAIPGVRIIGAPRINMVFVKVETLRTPDDLRADLAAHGFLSYPPEYGVFRFVTHHGVSTDDVRTFAEVFQQALHAR